MMQIVVSADKSAVSAQKAKLYSYIGTAKRVTAQSSFAVIREAETALHKTQAMFEILSALELLDDFSVTKEDLDRIERKIADILDEKRRSDMIRRH